MLLYKPGTFIAVCYVVMLGVLSSYDRHHCYEVQKHLDGLQAPKNSSPSLRSPLSEPKELWIRFQQPTRTSTLKENFLTVIQDKIGKAQALIHPTLRLKLPNNLYTFFKRLNGVFSWHEFQTKLPSQKTTALHRKAAKIKRLNFRIFSNAHFESHVLKDCTKLKTINRVHSRKDSPAKLWFQRYRLRLADRVQYRGTADRSPVFSYVARNIKAKTGSHINDVSILSRHQEHQSSLRKHLYMGKAYKNQRTDVPKHRTNSLKHRLYWTAKIPSQNTLQLQHITGSNQKVLHESKNTDHVNRRNNFILKRMQSRYVKHIFPQKDLKRKNQYSGKELSVDKVVEQPVLMFKSYLISTDKLGLVNLSRFKGPDSSIIQVSLQPDITPAETDRTTMFERENSEKMLQDSQKTYSDMYYLQQAVIHGNSMALSDLPRKRIGTSKGRDIIEKYVIRKGALWVRRNQNSAHSSIPHEEKLQSKLSFTASNLSLNTSILASGMSSETNRSIWNSESSYEQLSVSNQRIERALTKMVPFTEKENVTDDTNETVSFVSNTTHQQPPLRTTGEHSSENASLDESIFRMKLLSPYQIPSPSPNTKTLHKQVLPNDTLSPKHASHISGKFWAIFFRPRQLLELTENKSNGEHAMPFNKISLDGKVDKRPKETAEEKVNEIGSRMIDANIQNQGMNRNSGSRMDENIQNQGMNRNRGSRMIDENIQSQDMNRNSGSRMIDENIQNQDMKRNSDSRMIDENIQNQGMDRNSDSAMIDENIQNQGMDRNSGGRMDENIQNQGMDRNSGSRTIDENIQNQGMNRNSGSRMIDENIQNQGMNRNNPVSYAETNSVIPLHSFEEHINISQGIDERVNRSSKDRKTLRNDAFFMATDFPGNYSNAREDNNSTIHEVKKGSVPATNGVDNSILTSENSNSSLITKRALNPNLYNPHLNGSGSEDNVNKNSENEVAHNISFLTPNKYLEKETFYNDSGEDYINKSLDTNAENISFGVKSHETGFSSEVPSFYKGLQPNTTILNNESPIEFVNLEVSDSGNNSEQSSKLGSDENLLREVDEQLSKQPSGPDIGFQNSGQTNFVNSSRFSPPSESNTTYVPLKTNISHDFHVNISHDFHVNNTTPSATEVYFNSPSIGIGNLTGSTLSRSGTEDINKNIQFNLGLNLSSVASNARNQTPQIVNSGPIESVNISGKFNGSLTNENGDLVPQKGHAASEELDNRSNVGNISISKDIIRNEGLPLSNETVFNPEKRNQTDKDTGLIGERLNNNTEINIDSTSLEPRNVNKTRGNATEKVWRDYNSTQSVTDIDTISTSLLPGITGVHTTQNVVNETRKVNNVNESFGMNISESGYSNEDRTFTNLTNYSTLWNITLPSTSVESAKPKNASTVTEINQYSNASDGVTKEYTPQIIPNEQTTPFPKEDTAEDNVTTKVSKNDMNTNATSVLELSTLDSVNTQSTNYAEGGKRNNTDDYLNDEATFEGDELRLTQAVPEDDVNTAPVETSSQTAFRDFSTNLNELRLTQAVPEDDVNTAPAETSSQNAFRDFPTNLNEKNTDANFVSTENKFTSIYPTDLASDQNGLSKTDYGTSAERENTTNSDTEFRMKRDGNSKEDDIGIPPSQLEISNEQSAVNSGIEDAQDLKGDGNIENGMLIPTPVGLTEHPDVINTEPILGSGDQKEVTTKDIAVGINFEAGVEVDLGGNVVGPSDQGKQTWKPSSFESNTSPSDQEIPHENPSVNTVIESTMSTEATFNGGIVGNPQIPPPQVDTQSPDATSTSGHDFPNLESKTVIESLTTVDEREIISTTDSNSEQKPFVPTVTSEKPETLTNSATNFATSSVTTTEPPLSDTASKSSLTTSALNTADTTSASFTGATTNTNRITTASVSSDSLSSTVITRSFESTTALGLTTGLTVTAEMISTSASEGEQLGGSPTPADVKTSPSTPGLVNVEVVTEISSLQNSKSTTTEIFATVAAISFHFTINANYDEVVGNRKEEFVENLRPQLARAMRIPHSCIQNLQVTKGSIEVSFNLVPDDTYGHLADEEALKTAVEELKRMIDNGKLDLTDLDGNTLLVIPIDPPTTPTSVLEKEHTTLILGIVIGVFVVTVITIAIVAVVMKSKSLGGRRLSPIEEARSKLPSYREIPFQEALYVKGNGRGQHQGKYCVDSGKWLGPGPEPYPTAPNPAAYRPPTDLEIRNTPRPPSSVRARLRNNWNLEWDAIMPDR